MFAKSTTRVRYAKLVAWFAAVFCVAVVDGDDRFVVIYNAND